MIPDLGFKRRTPLMDSIWLRDDEGFRDFLKSGVDPDEIADCETIELNRGTSWPERTSAAPLFAAALVGELRYVEALLSAGADPNRSADNGSCSLHAATANGSVAIVDALIDAGAHPDPQDRYGKTPLMLAAQYRYLDVVDRLLTAGADADLGDVHRQTARDFARWGRYPEIAERLERSE